MNRQPSRDSADRAGARLDPWCLVALEDGTNVLFGYAVEHPVTGGLAWLSSSEVLKLDGRAERATTRSGRRYRLGRRFDAVDVGAEGEEARLAFELLLGLEFEDMDTVRDIDRAWVAGCKAARHLGVLLPSRTRAGVKDFVEEHLARYLALRGSREMP